jgi:citrate synthase
MHNVDQSQVSDQSGDYLSARDAAGLLGVKLPTLYAYASRGLVQSVPAGRGRSRAYRRADLERLRARRDARAGHGAVAAGALRWGEPVLDSAISAISPEQGPLYRGHPAVELAAADAAFESVAELLWSREEPAPGGRLPLGDPTWAPVDLGVPVERLGGLLAPGLPPLSALAVVLPLLACRDPGRFVQRPEAVLPRARALVRRLSAALAPGLSARELEAALAAGSVASAVALALGSRAGEDGERAINRALVLVADHELNASAFAARVAASTGADLYACVGAAVGTLSGPRHGGAADRVEALVSEIAEPGAAERVVQERARRGEMPEGFGHPLYPAGDPRGAMLLALAREIAPRTRAVRTCLALVSAMAEQGLHGPTMDMGLVALASALGLGPGAAVGIFAVGRCAGWVAHALEQYEAGYLVRPRARYLGPD